MMQHLFCASCLAYLLKQATMPWELLVADYNHSIVVCECVELVLHYLWPAVNPLQAFCESYASFL